MAFYNRHLYAVTFSSGGDFLVRLTWKRVTTLVVFLGQILGQFDTASGQPGADSVSLIQT